MDTALTWFMRIWIGLVVALNVIGIIGFFLTAPSLWEGWLWVAEIYSPFNVVNYLAEIVSLSPAIGAHYLRGRLRTRRAA